MGYRKKYTRTGENSIPTYNWEDIAEGTGTVLFYGFTSTSGGQTTLNYNLGTSIINPGYTVPTTVTDHEYISSLSAVTARTFSLSPFTQTRIIKGKAYINVTLTSTSSGTNPNFYPVVAVYKNNTQIAYASGAATSGASTNRTYNLALSIPNTHYGVGDVLSITVSGSITGGGQLFMCHDPNNNNISTYAPAGAVGNIPNVTAATNPTTFKSYIPFKIER